MILINLHREYDFQKKTIVLRVYIKSFLTAEGAEDTLRTAEDFGSADFLCGPLRLLCVTPRLMDFDVLKRQVEIE